MGFTVPELLAALFIGSLVITGVFRFVLPLVQTMGRIDARLTADNNGQVALAHLRSAALGVGDWQCQGGQGSATHRIGGGTTRYGSGVLTWPEHLPGFSAQLSDWRLPGTDILWVGQLGATASSACEASLARATVYFLARNVADRPALYRQDVWPDPGRRQEIVAGVSFMRLLFGVRVNQSIHWVTADALGPESAVAGLRIALALSEPAPGSGTDHPRHVLGEKYHLTTDRPSVVRIHSTAVHLTGPNGSPL